MYPNLFYLPEWFPIGAGAPVTSFGVMMMLSFLTAGYVLKAGLVREGHDADIAWSLVFWAVIGGVIGARLYYVFLNYPRLLADPAGMLLSRGGMVWYGGFLLAAALVVWRIRMFGLPLGKTADAAAPALALAYAVGRVGCFLVGDDYGRPTDSWVGIAFPNGLPPTTATAISSNFGITIDPALIEKYGEVLPVHPTQLYETGISTLIFLLLWRLRGHGHRAGWLFMVWLALAGAERFFVEIFRAKDDRFFGVFTLAQVISLLLVAFGTVWVLRLRNRRGTAAV
ncbi:MAG: prolipoprotein diacylglyceryl transferase [Gemmatimonadetes bacterium]|nr:prolipoprotein diacylglyceryl transferase [Gemmatimonadota bacterium]MCY3612580.1 prolipoprotein diacylglyceryl transferase [Gemmatimonadota bacterium]MCY3676303.1 prolipoprotein diacylglyceryl transferase [Gemmatimonadota bacterium]MYA42801.1 prolipoprotein diacylglyceryl transferase [Gemmatimonadota bacterium]MYE92543.1 prolipoprotein diacylglyceryl transferase [Gemmatimonadota bacterium]